MFASLNSKREGMEGESAGDVRGRKFEVWGFFADPGEQLGGLFLLLCCGWDPHPCGDTWDLLHPEFTPGKIQVACDSQIPAAGTGLWAKQE